MTSLEKREIGRPREKGHGPAKGPAALRPRLGRGHWLSGAGAFLPTELRGPLPSLSADPGSTAQDGAVWSTPARQRRAAQTQASPGMGVQRATGWGAERRRRHLELATVIATIPENQRLTESHRWASALLARRWWSGPPPSPLATLTWGYKAYGSGEGVFPERQMLYRA